MTNPNPGFQGGPTPGFQQTPPGNGIPAGHVPMPPGMGAFDSQVARPGAQGYPSSQMPPVQQQQTQQQAPAGQLMQPQQQQQPASQVWDPFRPPQQQAPQFQPQQQQPAPQQVPQQQFQPAQPQQQGTQQQAPVVMGTQTILDGPEIPAELRGRTWGEAMQIYQGLRNVALRTLPQAAAAPQSQMNPPVPPQQQQQQVQAPAQQQPPVSDFFRDPKGAIRQAVLEETGRVRQEMQQSMQQMMQPFMQQNLTQGVTQLHAQMAQEVGPGFASIEPRVLDLLRGVEPQQLLNPEVWRIAVNTAVGEQVRASRRAPQQQQQSFQQQPIPQGSTPAGRFPIQQQNGNPLPNLGSFFSEIPGSAPANQGPPALTQEELWAAQAMNMNPADYAAWKGGIQRRS